MAKKKTPSVEDQQRQSRKAILIARKQESQTRQIRLVIGLIILMLLIVLVAGLVNEFVIKPNLPVATVSGTEIPMVDWRSRVRLQRAQLILGIEDLAEALGQDIGQVQQFAGQQLLLLTQDSERLGQVVLDQMIDEILIEQEAGIRGISVSESDVQLEIEESFNYFGGASPTEEPTPTETTIPTPSITPLPTAVITEIVPTNTPFPTSPAGPTSTPFPTPTAVSSEAFDEVLGDTLDRLRDLGIPEESFREIVRAQLYRQKLIEQLAKDEELPSEAMHSSFFYLLFDNEDEANKSLETIEQEGYMAYWNRIRSLPQDPEDQNPVLASEVIWRTRQDVDSLLNEEVGEAAFESPLNSESAVIIVPAETEEGDESYYIIYVSGRENRPLSESAIQNAEAELLNSWLQGRRISAVESFERWRANVPSQPIIDSRFFVAPTPTPFVPIEVTPDPENDE